MKNKLLQNIWVVVLVNSLPPAIGDGRIESNHLVGTPDLWSRKVWYKGEERRKRCRIPLNIFRRCAYRYECAPFPHTVCEKDAYSQKKQRESE